MSVVSLLDEVVFRCAKFVHGLCVEGFENVDIFAANIAMPHLREGDHVALLHSGGYGASMSSNHCMRGAFCEYLV